MWWHHNSLHCKSMYHQCNLEQLGHVSDISNISWCIREESTSLRWCDCRLHTVTAFQQTTKRKSASAEFPEGKNVFVLFYSNWIWQKPDLATCSAGCFRRCNYHFSSSCLFHAFNGYTDGLNHCQTTAQPDWPQSFLEKHWNGWKARRTHKQRRNRNASWFIGCLQHFKRGTADVVGVTTPTPTFKGKFSSKICCFHQPANVFLHSFRYDHFFLLLIFRLQLDANDVSYCIYGAIHLCLFPSLSPPFTHPLASVISFCNESSSAHQWLKMILEILIRAPF